MVVQEFGERIVRLRSAFYEFDFTRGGERVTGMVAIDKAWTEVLDRIDRKAREPERNRIASATEVSDVIREEGLASLIEQVQVHITWLAAMSTRVDPSDLQLLWREFRATIPAEMIGAVCCNLATVSEVKWTPIDAYSELVPFLAGTDEKEAFVMGVRLPRRFPLKVIRLRYLKLKQQK
jgi:hypothetical protein